MVGSLFSSDAWNNVTFAAAEVQNPRRNLPLALAAGTLLVAALYVLANVAYLNVLPLDQIQHAAEDRVGTAAAQVIFGDAGRTVMAIAILISTFGCNNGLILSGARVYYAMAHDGLFFRTVGPRGPAPPHAQGGAVGAGALDVRSWRSRGRTASCSTTSSSPRCSSTS